MLGKYMLLLQPKGDATRSTIFDNLDSTPPSTLRPEQATAYTKWWQYMAQATAAGMPTVIEPQFVADFVAWVHTYESDFGAILVFLDGFQSIKDVNSALQEAQLQNALLLPLHGDMGTANQRIIFDRPPAGTRKIVLATNIAETSITIDDVTVVVDCGIAKVTSYDAVNKMRQLTSQWCEFACLRVHVAVPCVRGPHPR